MDIKSRKVTAYGIALIGIIFVGAFLRLYNLGAESLWWDEAFSIFVSKMSVPQMMQAIEADTHPPLYFLILHYWIILFGASENAVRMLSALCGVLAIPVVYGLGNRLFTKEVGLLAALIFALSTFNIQYSQETRMYSLMVLLALLSMYFFIRFMRESTVAVSFGYVMFTTLLLYTHIYGVFVVIAENIYLLTLLFSSRERLFQLKHWIVFQALLVVFFAPWVYFLLLQISVVEGGGVRLAAEKHLTVGTLLQTLAIYSGGSISYVVTRVTKYANIAAILFSALSVLSLFTYTKVRGSMNWKAPINSLRDYRWKLSFTRDYYSLYFLAVSLFVINIIPFVISLISRSIYLSKYAIVASAALYLITAKGISHINYKNAKLAIVLVVVVVSAANLQNFYTTTTKHQAREAIGLINENAANEDVVLVYPYTDFLTDYYGFKAGVRVVNATTPVVLGQTAVINDFQVDISSHNRVWLLTTGYVSTEDMDKLTQVFHSASYNMVDHTYYFNCRVYVFEKQAA